MHTYLKLALLQLIIASASIAQSADSGATSPQSAPPLSGKLGTPVVLFNGTDLNGWVWFQAAKKPGVPNPAVARDEVFSVKEGILHSAGKPNGYLRYDKPFKNYVILVEERHVLKGNGGILVGIRGPDKIWPGLEIQTMTGAAGDLWNHNKLKMVTDPARTKNTHVLRAGPDTQKPVGEWEIMEVTVDSGNLIFKVNGVVQNVANETEDLSGEIALQVEGAEMEFRKVQIIPIE